MNDLLLQVSALLAKPEFHLTCQSDPKDFLEPLVKTFGPGIYPYADIAVALLSIEQELTKSPVYPDDYYGGF